MATTKKSDHLNSHLFLKDLLNSCIKTYSQLLSILLLVLVFCSSSTFVAFSQSIVKTLPGYDGDLPFKLETGYVSVGEWNDVHLFYYFIESEGNPSEDPLILWLTGGPGPLRFDAHHFDGKFPNFTLNPFSWTKVANIIFLDAPVGTGFSYADYAESYVSDDLLSATDTYHFLLKWLMNHPAFLSNELCIAGDSYSGIMVPIIVQKIVYGISVVGVKPVLNLQGYILGNPVTSQHDDKNARIEFAHQHAILSDKLYESIKHNCHGEYVTIDPNNAACIKDLTLVTEAYDDFVLSYIWTNDDTVRQALHIRKGTKEKWTWCNESLSYTEVVYSSIDYHRNLSDHTDLRALIYSGDHDMLVPYLGTHRWIDQALGLTVDEEWRPWFVDGQNGGYTMKYNKNGYHLTFATVKGGGHTAPEYKPKEAFVMIERWLAFYDL